jgi:hypothetical protein
LVWLVIGKERFNFAEGNSTMATKYAWVSMGTIGDNVTNPIQNLSTNIVGRRFGNINEKLALLFLFLYFQVKVCYQLSCIIIGRRKK